jgi:hypothetical protein
VIKNPLYYRCYNSAFHPPSVLGAIADGARFNIGGSQAGGPAKTLGPLASKRGAIYLSESWETTLLEAFSEVAHPDSIAALAKMSPHVAIAEVKIKTRTQLRLVDFEKALKDIHAAFPAIAYHLSLTADMTGLWGDLKRPAPCQLLGHWLIDNASKADGIRYQSTTDPLGHNVCLHLKDDLAAKALLRTKLFSIP